MQTLLNRHRHSNQPEYHTKPEKIKAREQVIAAYREITKLQSIPVGKGYWTLCNKQPDLPGVEIVELVKHDFIQKNQFFGIDYDLKNEGIIEFNKQQHPDAHWFQGEWLDVIDKNYERFNPALVYFDYTKTVMTIGCHIYLAKTMNMCHSKTVVAANLMLSDGHSRKRFDPELLVESLGVHLRHPNDWTVFDRFYSYKASQTEMATYIFIRG